MRKNLALLVGAGVLAVAAIFLIPRLITLQPAGKSTQPATALPQTESLSESHALTGSLSTETSAAEIQPASSASVPGLPGMPRPLTMEDLRKQTAGAPTAPAEVAQAAQHEREDNEKNDRDQKRSPGDDLIEVNGRFVQLGWPRISYPSRELAYANPLVRTETNQVNGGQLAPHLPVLCFEPGIKFAYVFTEPDPEDPDKPPTIARGWIYHPRKGEPLHPSPPLEEAIWIDFRPEGEATWEDFENPANWVWPGGG